MITLDNSNEFTFKTKDGTKLSGTFRDLNMKEKADFEARSQENLDLATKVNKLVKSINRNEKRIEHFESKNDYERADNLIAENEELSKEVKEIAKENNANEISNKMLRDRFDLCLGGIDRDTIIKIAEKIGYKPVFDVIQKAIIEGKLKS